MMLMRYINPRMAMSLWLSEQQPNDDGNHPWVVHVCAVAVVDVCECQERTQRRVHPSPPPKALPLMWSLQSLQGGVGHDLMRLLVIHSHIDPHTPCSLAAAAAVVVQSLKILCSSYFPHQNS